MAVDEQNTRDLARCYHEPAYFVEQYVRIYDAIIGDWTPFTLWPDQRNALQLFHVKQLVVALKARQVGMTWLALAYALWTMLFRPAATILLFSKRDNEATFLLGSRENVQGDSRLRGMFWHLPEWLQSGHVVTNDSAHEWSLSNGSTARAFPTTAGDSYTGTLAIVDEADLAPDLNVLMRAVKPTIDAGGKMFLISRSDKAHPNSEFKRLYKAARAARRLQTAFPWYPLFIPWQSRPDRTQEWYEVIKDEIEQRTGSLDDLHEQYPATDDEALGAKTQDKRIPYRHLAKCYQQTPVIPIDDAYAQLLQRIGGALEDPKAEEERQKRIEALSAALDLPGLLLFEVPAVGAEYVLGADPAEGNPESDESSSTVLNRITGNQAAVLSARIEPSVFASYIEKLCTLFNAAQAMVERNNHGHAVIMWLLDNSSVHVMYGHDGKHGFSTSSLSKSLLYDEIVKTLREGDTMIRDDETYLQLQSIEAATLRAPEGLHDDRAMSYCLANTSRPRQGSGIYI